MRQSNWRGEVYVDMPLPPALARWLANQGHDAVHACIYKWSYLPYGAVRLVYGFGDWRLDAVIERIIFVCIQYRVAAA